MGQTLLLLLEYDGTRYAGWQRQPQALTVQEVLEHALRELAGERLHAVAAGRTDAGVHARGQVVHVRLPHPWRIPQERTPKALNSLLPEDVRVIRAQLTDQPIHARYSARARWYSYTLSRRPSVFERFFCWYVPYPFEPELLEAAATIWLGEHDFTTFSRHHPETRSYVCRVYHTQWEQLDEHRWRFHICANRFVYGMVRALVGAMLQVARRRRTLQELLEALQARDRRRAAPLAPPHGLVLERVEYPPELHVQLWQ
jgi:pseudouridylate synthase I